MSTPRPTPQTAERWQARFFTIWGGQQLSSIGSTVAGFALIWWVTATTGSATVLATATMVSLLPQVFLGPFVGALVDRWSRRLIMLVADSAIALVSAWLAYLFWADAIQIWHLYVVMLLRALGGAFHFPAMSASTTLLVPEKHYARVAGLNQMMGGAAGVLGPVLGALLFNALPLWGIMAVDVVTAAFAVGPLLFLSVPQPARSAEQAAGESLWTSAKAGLRFIVAWKGLLALMLMALLLNFLAYPPMSLLPILVKRHFQGGALQLGWLNSAFGLGLVLGGLLLGTWGGFKRRIITILVGIAGLSVALVVIGLTPAGRLPLAVGALFVGAVLNALCNGSAFALMQAVVPPEVQGRVFTVEMSLTGAASPLAMAIAGPIADAVDIRWLYVVPGALSLIMAVIAFRTPAIMHLEEERGGAPAPAGEPTA